jgi:hypothetical protein
MSNEPLFQSIFGKPWSDLPPVMRQHYAVRADSQDEVVVDGVMTIRRGLITRILSPILRRLGSLPAHDGHDIPVRVRFYSGKNSHSFHFDRLFKFPDRDPVRFHSHLEPVSGHEVIEFMTGGIGWRAHYSAEGDKIRLRHIGYVWRIGPLRLPVPLKWILGVGQAEEEALSDDRFRMWMAITHPFFGESYRYDGTFRITSVTYG